MPRDVIEVERSIDALAGSRRRRRRRAAASRCPPTRRCSSCATCSSERGLAPGLLGMSSAPRVWHEVECGGYAADLAVWERLAGARRRRRCSSSAAGPAGSRLHLARRGHEVCGGRRRSGAAGGARARASRERAAGRTRRAPTSARSQLEREFELVIAPMQRHPDARRRGGAATLLGAAPAHLAAGGRLAAAIVDEPDGLARGAGAAAAPGRP